jgi:type VI secretion system protein ImpB
MPESPQNKLERVQRPRVHITYDVDTGGATKKVELPFVLTDPGSKPAVELGFRHRDDFEPARVAGQIGPLKQLLEMRQELTQLLSRMEGNDKHEQFLTDVDNTEKATGVARVLEAFVRASAPTRGDQS